MRARHYNFVVVALTIIKSCTDIKLDVFRTIVTKAFVTPLLLLNDDVMTFILANAQAQIPDALNSQTPSLNLAEIWYLNFFSGGGGGGGVLVLNIQSDFTFENF